MSYGFLLTFGESSIILGWWIQIDTLACQVVRNDELASLLTSILCLPPPLPMTPGFITMTPQLFINYKLKSVAHLPWRMLTYKALNTFIDDLFAFVIKMPTMYRIGCFRDGKSPRFSASSPTGSTSTRSTVS